MQGRGRGRAARRVPTRAGRSAAGGETPQQATCTKRDARQGCVRHVRGLRSGRTDRERREETPGSKVASAPWAPVPARACTGRAATEARPTRASRHRAAGRRAAQRLRLRRRPAEAEAACRPFGPTDATDPIAWSTCRSPPPRPPRASTPSAAGAPRLQKSCRWRRPQSKGRSCVSGRARRDLRARGGRGHLSERPGWPSGAPIARGSTISMIAFGGRRGPHRSGSRCRDCRIERREAGREGCLWPDAASQGRPPDGSGLRGESIS